MELQVDMLISHERSQLHSGDGRLSIPRLGFGASTHKGYLAALSRGHCRLVAVITHHGFCMLTKSFWDQNGRSVRLLPCLSPFQSLLTATILVIVFLTLESSSLVSAATVPASDPSQLILQIMTPSSRNMSSIMRMCCVELRSSRRLVTKSVPRLPDPRENGLRRHWKLSSAGIGSGLGPGEPSAGPD